MGGLTGKTTARRGANGEVEYYQAPYTPGDRANQSGNGSWLETAGNRILHPFIAKKARENSALKDLLSSEEAAAKNNTTSLYGSAGNVSDQPTGGSVATTTAQATEGNPGMGDNEANSDIDLSTSDTTIRRKAGYRRDSGIRI